MTFEEKLGRYAEVLVKIGLDLRKGQSVCIEAPTEQAEFVAKITSAAYKAGASRVGVIWKNDAVERIMAENQPIEPLECDRAVAEYYAAEGAGYIRLDCPDMKAFEGLSVEKLSEKAMADSVIRGIFREKAKDAGQTIACVPTKNWADLVYPELPEEERLQALWEAVFQCCRCDCDDPVEAWKKYIADTNQRKKILDAKQYIKFHYKSEKTDFTICPVKNQTWMGGCMEMPNGRVFVPNIPTEEVFTTPDRRTANGYVSSTLPLNYRGQMIDSFKLWLEDGKVVRYEAKQGEEVLKMILDTDEGSRYLGEMALIDQASPIASLGHVFYTTLYDENASCHIALGNAYGPDDPKLRRELGFNDCKIHVDFMIGSDDMQIEGQLPDGTWENIMINGHWALAR